MCPLLTQFVTSASVNMKLFKKCVDPKTKSNSPNYQQIFTRDDAIQEIKINQNLPQCFHQNQYMNNKNIV